MAQPGSGLVHVYAQASGAGTDLILFVVADAVEAAEGYAAEVLGRALTVCGTGSELVRCTVELFLPAAEAQLPPDL